MTRAQGIAVAVARLNPGLTAAALYQEDPEGFPKPFGSGQTKPSNCLLVASF